MSREDAVNTLVARTLGISADVITDDLAFSDVVEWDSLNHVNLMIALEQMLETEVNEDLMVQLTSVRAIREFVAQHRAATP